MTYAKKLVKALKTIGGATLLRLFLVAVSLIAELTVLVCLSLFVGKYSVAAELALKALALLGIVFLFNKRERSAYKLMWIIIILLFPVFGITLYFLWGRVDVDRKEKGNITAVLQTSGRYLSGGEDCLRELERAYPAQRKIARNLTAHGYPVYQGTAAEYYPLGEAQFEGLYEALERAERFIFLEFFIIADGKVWDRTREILLRKAGEGVEVRILYDDAASVIFMNRRVQKELTAKGAQITAFNPVNRHVNNLYLNYRNHQKIVVIDGNVGFTGGTNLADEYANLYNRHGHYKDTAVKLIGEAVWSMTVIFLRMWNIARRTNVDEYEQYRPMAGSGAGAGFVQPYADGPATNPQSPAKDLILQIIEGANSYVYLTTPYLIVGDDILGALCRAAVSGVDVRIVTPSIPDHPPIHVLTVSNYGRLMEAGVRVYEYTPGFIHAKMLVSDDVHASVGTVNLDYRSLYIHYEDGVWFCGSPLVREVKDDILDTIAVSKQVELEEWRRRPWHRKALEDVLNFFSSLM